jgi:hypothetical protein
MCLHAHMCVSARVCLAFQVVCAHGNRHGQNPFLSVFIARLQRGVVGRESSQGHWHRNVGAGRAEESGDAYHSREGTQYLLLFVGILWEFDVTHGDGACVRLCLKSTAGAKLTVWVNSNTSR